MDRQPNEPSGEALDRTIAEMYELALRLQQLRAVMGHIAFKNYRPQDRRILADAGRILKELGGTVDSQAGTLAEVMPPTQEALFDALLGAEHWNKVFYTRTDEAYEIAIISDTAVRVDNRDKQLAPEHVFALNQLLMDPRPFNTKTLQQLMQTPDGEEITLQQVRAIVSGLHLLLGEEAMVWKLAGSKFEFYLRREVVVLDERHEIAQSETADPAVLNDQFNMPPGVTGADGDFYVRPLPAIADPLDTLSNKPGGATVWFELGGDPEKVGKEGYEWSDIETISRLAGVTQATAGHFVRRHASRLGDEFMPPELRKPHMNVPTGALTEHFPPQFVEWAVVSLRAARATHIARVEQRATG